MSENLHERAQLLSAKALIERLQPAEEAWLREHRANCTQCAQEALATQEALRALRSVAVLVPRDLASRTQLRVRLRAHQISQTANGSYLLWVITAASWLLGVLSAPLVWKLFAWAGGNVGLPKLAVEAGFLLWWTVPALVAVSVVLHRRVVSAGTKGV